MLPPPLARIDGEHRSPLCRGRVLATHLTVIGGVSHNDHRKIRIIIPTVHCRLGINIEQECLSLEEVAYSATVNHSALVRETEIDLYKAQCGMT
jgi:hypothetical protein